MQHESNGSSIRAEAVESGVLDDGRRDLGDPDVLAAGALRALALLERHGLPLADSSNGVPLHAELWKKYSLPSAPRMKPKPFALTMLDRAVHWCHSNSFRCALDDGMVFGCAQRLPEGPSALDKRGVAYVESESNYTTTPAVSELITARNGRMG